MIGGFSASGIHARAIWVTIAGRVSILYYEPIGLLDAVDREHFARGFAGRHPTRDFIEIEAPYAADFETWQSAVFKQTINGYPMNVQMVC